MESKAKILWLSENLLFSSAMLTYLQANALDVIALSHPKVALNFLTAEQVSVVVLALRCEDSVDIDFLVKARALQPNAIRILITDDENESIIEQAINRANIFRFHIMSQKKEDILHDLIWAINEHPVKAIDSEAHFFSDTKKNPSTQESQLRDANRLLEALGRIENMEDALTILRADLKGVIGSSEITCLIEQSGHLPEAYSTQGKHMIQHFIGVNLPAHGPHRSGDHSDRQWLADLLGRPVGHMIVIPVLRREGESLELKITFFIETLADWAITESKLTRLMDQLQAVGLIFDRIVAIQSLQSSARQWEATFDSLGDPIAILDKNNHVVRANIHFRRQNSRQCFEAFADQKEVCRDCPVGKTLKSSSAQSSTISLGQQLFEVNSFPISLANLDGPSHVINHYIDVTEERRLASTLMRQERMAALGRLAGDVAHEINNPLTGIKSLAEFLKSKIESEGLKNDLGEVIDAAKRSQNIIKNLLSFTAAETDHDLENVDLNQMVAATMPLLKTITRNYFTEVIEEKSRPKVRARFGLLQQVLFNLVTNAAHSMSEKGHLIISVFENNTEVGFFVKDSGSGIPADQKKFIFQPFFTTKPEGFGTGLGLNMCQKIVNEYGGKITFSSEVGVGTEFRVTFSRSIV